MKERKESQKGALAVEFALVLPVLLLLILAIIELSFFLFNRAVITNAAREGARAGIVQRSPSEGRVPFSEIEDKGQELLLQSLDYVWGPDDTQCRYQNCK